MNKFIFSARHVLLILGISLFGFCLSAQELYKIPQGQQSRVSSFENMNGEKGSGGKTNNGGKGNAYESLNAGETKSLLETKDPGMIQRIWVTINDRSFKMLRSLRLR